MGGLFPSPQINSAKRCLVSYVVGPEVSRARRWGGGQPPQVGPLLLHPKLKTTAERGWWWWWWKGGGGFAGVHPPREGARGEPGGEGEEGAGGGSPPDSHLGKRNGVFFLKTFSGLGCPGARSHCQILL